MNEAVGALRRDYDPEKASWIGRQTTGNKQDHIRSARVLISKSPRTREPERKGRTECHEEPRNSTFGMGIWADGDEGNLLSAKFHSFGRAS